MHLDLTPQQVRALHDVLAMHCENIESDEYDDSPEFIKAKGTGSDDYKAMAALRDALSARIVADADAVSA